MNNILIEIFPNFVENSDIHTLLKFYMINKTYQQLLSSKYILIKINKNCNTIEEVINYYKIGLPAYQALSMFDGFLESTYEQFFTKSTRLSKYIDFNKDGTIKVFQCQFLDTLIHLNSTYYMFGVVFFDYQLNIQYCSHNKKFDHLLKNYLSYFIIQYKSMIEKHTYWLKNKLWLLLENKNIHEATEILTELGYENYIN